MTVLAELQQKGLVRYIGLSNVTPTQIAEARRIAPIVCVQNHYNLAHRTDDTLITDLARDGIAYVPFFPLGGFTPLQSTTLSDIAARLSATPMQVALAWLFHRSPNILVIPGTSSIKHLRENLQSSMLQIPPDVIVDLDGLGGNVSHWRHPS
jgi:aryl-alcohol dehydrogenase-like predicted oxidoreductase